MPEFQAHLNSYDHHHNQRMKDMKSLSRNPMGVKDSGKVKKAVEKESGMISIKLPTSEDKPMKKGKGGFKKAFGASSESGGVRKEEVKNIMEVKKEEAGEKKGGSGGEKYGGKVGGMLGGDIVKTTSAKPTTYIDPTGPMVDWTGTGEVWNEGPPGYEYYNPAFATGCHDGCACHFVEI
jgi:hypothetical protein